LQVFRNWLAWRPCPKPMANPVSLGLGSFPVQHELGSLLLIHGRLLQLRGRCHRHVCIRPLLGILACS
jgi:hypothetical protein